MYIYSNHFKFLKTTSNITLVHFMYCIKLILIAEIHPSQLDGTINSNFNLTRFLLLLAIYLSFRCKNLSEALPHEPLTKAPPWICCRAYSTSLRSSPAFYNIQKLNLSSKTDISKTAWINPWTNIVYLLYCIFLSFTTTVTFSKNSLL